ncbi:hypothetical protein OO010_12290 [Flavobacteriaceae bacterium KMM 6898]|nr:hypothetical protein [Flavobacteriaceae bacterium KMM 6898]
MLDPLPTDLDGVSAKANLPSDVFDASDGTTVMGSATIHRSNNGVTINVKTSGLIPGNAYTMWIVAFNSPELCEDGCDGPDLGVANGDVMYGAGHVVGGNGKGNFSAHLSEGDVSGSLFPQPSPGLIDGQTTEVHIVVRDHGPKIPGMVSEQIHSINGGCNPGDSNEGLCNDVQFAIFLAD